MAIRSKADPIQITQRTFEEDLDAIRVVMLPTEMEMNLSTESGDSIFSVSQMTVHELKAGDVLDTSSARRMTCFPGGNIKAVILNQEIELTGVSSQPQDICVPAIKVEHDCIVVLQG